MKPIRSAAQILAEIQAQGGDVEDTDTPTPRHRACLDLVGQIRELAGQKLTDRQIAARLGVHNSTVQKHRAAAGIPPGLGRVGRPSGSGGMW